MPGWSERGYVGVLCWGSVYKVGQANSGSRPIPENVFLAEKQQQLDAILHLQQT